MRCKKYILFGILLVLLIKIIVVSASGLGSSLGGNINIPMGNQTFPNVTTSPLEDVDDSEDIEIIEDDEENETDLEDEEVEDDEEMEIIEDETEESDELEEAINITNSSEVNTQSTTDSDSGLSTYSESIQRFVKGFIKKISPDKVENNEEKRTQSETDEISELENDEETLNKVVTEFDNKKDVGIILVINTLCLFFAFVTLRSYNNSLDEES